jgi:hypothetical protein
MVRRQNSSNAKQILRYDYRADNTVSSSTCHCDKKVSKTRGNRSFTENNAMVIVSFYSVKDGSNTVSMSRQREEDNILQYLPGG